MKQTLNLMKCTYRNKLRMTFGALTLILGSYILLEIISGRTIDKIFFIECGYILINGIITIALFSILLTQYRDYRLSSQLNFSRTTFWLSKFLEILIISLVLIIYGIFTSHVFDAKASVNLITNMIFSIICGTFVGMSTLFAIGSFFALFRRLGKILVMVIGFYLLYIWATSNIHLSIITFVNKLFVSNFYVTLYISSAIWVILMFGLSFIFAQRMQIRDK